MAPHDHSLRGWAGGAYRPVGGSQGVESPQQSGVRIARAGSESCGAARRDPCHASSAPMLPVLLLLLATGANRGSLPRGPRSEEHTSELQSRLHLVCRLLLEKKKKKMIITSRR